MLVNEFLLCLERFKSIFIGSTNMLESMDPAAVRRFTFKVEFKTLLPEARVRMFEAFLLPFSGAALSEAEKKHLLSIPALTPGDFSVVAARARWMKGEGAENISLLESLAQEASYRQAGAAPGGAAGGAGAETPAGSAGRPSSVN
jgi:SpoVK/Ycf46/Vps4 family AAA+-type ATPase